LIFFGGCYNRPESSTDFDSFLNMNAINHALVDFKDYLNEISYQHHNQSATKLQKSGSIVNLPLLFELSNKIKFQKTHQQPHQNQYFCKEERNKLISRSSQKMPNNFSNDMNRNQYRNDNSYACPNCVLFFYLVFHF